jgi:hypothetical protein
MKTGCICSRFFCIEPFTPHSQNKSDGTRNFLEHRIALFVVGAGNAITRRYSMSNRFMMSVAIAALIAGTGFANAQGTGAAREAPSATTQQSAPPSERGAPSAATPMNRDAAPTGAASDAPKSDAPKSAQSKDMDRDGGKNQRAQDDMKAGPKGEKSAQDNNMKGERSKSMNSENEKAGAGKDMNRAEERNGNMNRADDRNGASKSTTTTGQAAAGGKLSTEQRTKITTVIKSQNVRPVTNVNFSISVGTRVPRNVGFHPLPAEIVTIYPDWRGYEFFLVSDQIVVVNPRTLEIVAVIDA